jgi:hypothetical protein
VETHFVVGFFNSDATSVFQPTPEGSVRPCQASIPATFLQQSEV